jgi:4-aminobutyrate aminotransferase-like enzyme
MKSNLDLGRELIKERDTTMGPNVSVFYKDKGGLVVTSTEGAYLIEVEGRRYLDCCDNVAGCGHSAPSIVEAGCTGLRRV